MWQMVPIWASENRGAKVGTSGTRLCFWRLELLWRRWVINARRRPELARTRISRGNFSKNRFRYYSPLWFSFCCHLTSSGVNRLASSRAGRRLEKSPYRPAVLSPSFPLSAFGEASPHCTIFLNFSNWNCGHVDKYGLHIFYNIFESFYIIETDTAVDLLRSLERQLDASGIDHDYRNRHQDLKRDLRKLIQLLENPIFKHNLTVQVKYALFVFTVFLFIWSIFQEFQEFSGFIWSIFQESIRNLKEQIRSSEENSPIVGMQKSASHEVKGHRNGAAKFLEGRSGREVSDRFGFRGVTPGLPTFSLRMHRLSRSVFFLKIIHGILSQLINIKPI